MEKKIAFDESELKNIEATYADGLSYNPFYSIEDAFRRHVPSDTIIMVRWLPQTGHGRWGRDPSDGSEWRKDIENYEVTLYNIREIQVYHVTECTTTIIYNYLDDPDSHEETVDIYIQAMKGKLP